MNSVEQAFTFGSLVWMHALFVDAPMAGTLGLVAVVACALDPLLRGVTELLPILVAVPAFLLSTQPYQFCMGTLACNLVSLSLRGTLLVEELSWPAMFAAYLLWFFGAVVYGKPASILLGNLMAAGEKKTE